MGQPIEQLINRLRAAVVVEDVATGCCFNRDGEMVGFTNDWQSNQDVHAVDEKDGGFRCDNCGETLPKGEPTHSISHGTPGEVQLFCCESCGAWSRNYTY